MVVFCIKKKITKKKITKKKITKKKITKNYKKLQKNKNTLPQIIVIIWGNFN